MSEFSIHMYRWSVHLQGLALWWSQRLSFRRWWSSVWWEYYKSLCGCLAFDQIIPCMKLSFSCIFWTHDNWTNFWQQRNFFLNIYRPPTQLLKALPHFDQFQNLLEFFVALPFELIITAVTLTFILTLTWPHLTNFLAFLTTFTSSNTYIFLLMTTAILSFFL